MKNSSLSFNQFAGTGNLRAGDPSRSSHSVLLWKMDDADDFDLSRDLIPAASIETVTSRPEFVLKMVQRQHLFAVILAAHPFNDDLRLLRQFLSQLDDAPPVVLLLTDCPYPMMSIEREFFAVGNLNDSLPELRDMFHSASAGGIAQRNQLAGTLADVASSQTDPLTRSLVNASLELKNILRDASQKRVVTVTGEVGTAKTLFSKMLLQSGTDDVAGSADRDCITFYAGSGDDRIVSSIRDLLHREHSPGTFIVSDPSPGEAYELANIFDSINGDPADSSRLLMLCDSASAVDSQSIQLAPLRDQRRAIPEITAGILTTLANRWPDMQISVSPEALQLMSKYRWPGNICQFNLTLAAAVLEGMSQRKNDMKTVSIGTDPIRILMPEQTASQSMQRAWLRERLNSVCDWFSDRGYGSTTSVRSVLNETLIQNAGLVWRCEQQAAQIRRAA